MKINDAIGNSRSVCGEDSEIYVGEYLTVSHQEYKGNGQIFNKTFQKVAIQMYFLKNFVSHSLNPNKREIGFIFSFIFII